MTARDDVHSHLLQLEECKNTCFIFVFYTFDVVTVADLSVYTLFDITIPLCISFVLFYTIGC